MKFGNALVKLIHHQSPVLIEEGRHGLGKLRLPVALRLPIREGNSEGVLVIEPASVEGKCV